MKLLILHIGPTKIRIKNSSFIRVGVSSKKTIRPNLSRNHFRKTTAFRMPIIHIAKMMIHAHHNILIKRPASSPRHAIYSPQSRIPCPQSDPASMASSLSRWDWRNRRWWHLVTAGPAHCTQSTPRCPRWFECRNCSAETERARCLALAAVRLTLHRLKCSRPADVLASSKIDSSSMMIILKLFIISNPLNISNAFRAR